MSRATRARTLPFARKLSEHPRELVALAVILDVVVLDVVLVVRGGVDIRALLGAMPS